MNSLNLEPRRGQVSLVSSEPITLEAITKLAEAAQLAGVPAGVRLTYIKLEHHYGLQNPEYGIEMSWEVPR